MQVLVFDGMAAMHTVQLLVALADTRSTHDLYEQMIAAHARSIGLIMVTDDARKFEKVPGLRIEEWGHPLG